MISISNQQQMTTWKPDPTFSGLFYPSVIFGIIFSSLAPLLLYFAYIIDDIEVEYSGRRCTVSSVFNFSTVSCDEFLNENIGVQCSCDVFFTLPSTIEGSVFMYYKLTNYYQNHRSYVNSYDSNQLSGRAIGNFNNCKPYSTEPYTGYDYAPCGALANSLFNDTVSLFYITESGSSIPVPILRTGIAWETDKAIKFKNPPSWKKTAPPPNWHFPVYMLDPSRPDNNGYENEALVVWMRAAAFPNFVKLYGRIDHDSRETFRHGLPKGTYRMSVDYNYPVFQFDGTKSIFLTNLTWMGSKNYFLGVAYALAGLQFIAIAVLCAAAEKEYSQSVRESEFSRTS